MSITSVTQSAKREFLWKEKKKKKRKEFDQITNEHFVTRKITPAGLTYTTSH